MGTHAELQGLVDVIEAAAAVIAPGIEPGEFRRLASNPLFQRMTGRASALRDAVPSVADVLPR